MLGQVCTDADVERSNMDIQIYSFEIEHDGHRFGGEIPAKSVENVLELIPTATAIEPLVDTYDVNEMLMLFNHKFTEIH